jgi:MFS family permease
MMASIADDNKSHAIKLKFRLYSLIFLLNSYSHGIIVPVLSLVLINKGLTLSNLSAVLALYGLTVAVLEVPTGIAADILGRKKVFCLSLVTSAASFTVILFGRGMLAISAGMILHGLSRALASGSFDALFIDWYIDNYGNEQLHKISTRISILDVTGLSIGAITGGLFPVISERILPGMGQYDLNLAVKIILAVLIAVMSSIFINDSHSSAKKNRISLKKHISVISSIVSKNSTILCILISVFATGYFLISLEAFWQPHFKSMLPDNRGWMMGIMAFLYLAAAMVGSISSEKSIDKFKLGYKRFYIAMRLLLGFSLMFLSFQSDESLFVVLYSVTYFLFGMANIPESSIINREISSDVRASILSSVSLVNQLGVLIGSLINSVIVNYISIQSIWLISSLMILVSSLIIFKRLWVKQ